MSIDADIPPQAGVSVTIAGTYAGGMKWQRSYENPHRQPLPAPAFDHFTFDFSPAPNSVAAPFLRAIILEGDGRAMRYSAEKLSAGLPIEERGWCLTTPRNEPAYITPCWWPGATVTTSEINRPWMFEVDGHAPNGTQIIVSVTGTDLEGNHWARDYSGPCLEPLPTADIGQVQWGLELRASPNGAATPSLSGIAIHADGRRHYRSAEQMMCDMEDDSLWLHKFDDGTSFVTLRALPPPFGGKPPRALDRLHELFAQGKLAPGAQFFDD